jgi:Protein of unknown function (DUF1565)
MRRVSHPSLVTFSVSLLLSLHVPAGLAAGKTLYVKTTGKDSASCTAAAPCRTITHAVAVADAGDTIAVGPGTFGESGGISISKDLTIAGGWFLATRVNLGWIDRSQTFLSVFTITLGAKVTLTGLTISGGTVGGINNRGTLTLANVWVWNNTVQGGVANVAPGTLTMTNVAIDHNSGGAGLSNDGTAYVIDTHIQGGYHQGPNRGDGVRNTGTLIMSRGLIAGNEGTGFSQFSYASMECTATAYLLNVTITGNQDRGIDAGCGQLILRHVTIAANTLQTGAGGGGGLQVGDTIPVLENSIVATNGGKQCGFAGEKSIDISYSLVGDDSCTSFLFPSSTAGNLVGVDPKLGALAYRAGEDWALKLFHIGANRAQALLPGSPAIDSGADVLCKNPLSFFGDYWLTDQLGVQRPVDGDGDGAAHCDMGAYEYQPPSTGGAPR